MSHPKTNPELIQQMMESQMATIQKHHDVSSTCFIALDKKDDDTVYLVPCIRNKDDIKKLAEKLNLASQRLFILAEKMNASPEPSEILH